MSPDLIMESFVYTLIYLVCLNLLCLYPIRAHLVVTPAWLLPVLLLQCVLCLALDWVPWVGSLLSAVLMLLIYKRIVRVETTKILFLFLLGTAFSQLGNFVFFLLKGTFIREEWHDLPMVLIYFALVTPPMMLLIERKLWPRLNSLRLEGIRWLWIVPAFLLTLIQTLTSRQLQGHLPPSLVLPYGVMINVFSITTAASTFLVLSVFEKSQDVANFHDTIAIVDMQIAEQSKRFAEITSYLDDVRRLRHDMSRHMRVLRTMLEDTEYDAARRYLKDYSSDASLNETVTYSANHIGDLIARHTTLRAKEAGIDCDIHCALPADCWITDTDLCVLLGNMTENALNACRLQTHGRKYIIARARIQGSEAYVTIENSCNPGAEDPTLRKKAGVSPSSGYGIPSIRSVAEKYNGVATFEKKGDVFFAAILLYQPVSDGNGEVRR